MLNPRCPEQINYGTGQWWDLCWRNETQWERQQLLTANGVELLASSKHLWIQLGGAHSSNVRNVVRQLGTGQKADVLLRRRIVEVVVEDHGISATTKCDPLPR